MAVYIGRIQSTSPAMRRHTLWPVNDGLGCPSQTNLPSSRNIKFLLKSTTGAFSSLSSRTFSAMMGCFGSSYTEQEKEEKKKQKLNSKEIEKQLKKDKLTFRATHRLLLLGNITHLQRSLMFC